MARSAVFDVLTHGTTVTVEVDGSVDERLDALGEDLLGEDGGARDPHARAGCRRR